MFHISRLSACEGVGVGEWKPSNFQILSSLQFAGRHLAPITMNLGRKEHAIAAVLHENFPSPFDEGCVYGSPKNAKFGFYGYLIGFATTRCCLRFLIE